MRLANDWKEYKVIATGDGEKLENWNGIILLRFNNLKTVEQELAKYFQNHGIIEQTIFDL